MLATVDTQSYTVGTEAGLRQEMEMILGKKQLCKILIFVENQQTTVAAENLNEVILDVVCTEKFRVPEVIAEKGKVGMIELPKSQSTDRLLQQADEIALEVKGSASLDPDIPSDAYTLTYLEGSDNYLRFPLKLTDCNGRITFVLRLGRDKSVLHTFFCHVQDLLALLGKRTVRYGLIYTRINDRVFISLGLRVFVRYGKLTLALKSWFKI